MSLEMKPDLLAELEASRPGGVRSAEGVRVAYDWDLLQDRINFAPAVRDLLGWPDNGLETGSADWRARFHPADQVRHEACLQQAVQRDGWYELDCLVTTAAGHCLPVVDRGHVIKDAAGRPIRLCGLLTSIAPTAADRLAAARLRELETLYASAPIGLALLDRDLRFVRINERLAEINGLAAADHLGRSAWEVVPGLQSAAEPLFRQVLATGEAITGVELHGTTLRQPGVPRDWLEAFYPLKAPDGTVTAVAVVVEEVTERKQAERKLLEEKRALEESRKRSDLLLAELRHRFRNFIATLEFITDMTARSAASVADMRERLVGRLMALSAAYRIFSDDRAERMTVRDLADLQLAPFCRPEDGRFKVEGPQVLIPPDAALSLGLILHELAVNAAKYGALANQTGTVTLAWSVTEAEPFLLHLAWTEKDGPPVTPPQRQGFGTVLISRSLAHQSGGSATLDFQPDGLRCLLSLALR